LQIPGFGDPPPGVIWLGRGRRALPQTDKLGKHELRANFFQEIRMAKSEKNGNREAKKPKKEKIKTIAAAPSQKTAAWQPTVGVGKKK
jgi:hypothetical protein